MLLVLGESDNRLNWGALGYARDTTAALFEICSVTTTCSASARVVVAAPRRIDPTAWLTSAALRPAVRSCTIRADVHGSDHCPVEMVIEIG